MSSIRVTLAQLNYTVGDFEKNTKKIIAAIEQAKQQCSHLVIFSELAICGYPPKDLLELDDFLIRCEESLKIVARACDGIACIVGVPVRNDTERGKRLFNAAVFIDNGKIVQVVSKSLLPTYDVFDEYRYFEPAPTSRTITFRGKKIALTVCEDLWNVGHHAIYSRNPMDDLMKEQPDLMINIAASPFSYLQVEERKCILKTQVERYKIPLLYVNQVGAQTDLIFDGGSLAFDKYGNLIDELVYFEEQVTTIDLDDLMGAHSTSCSFMEATAIARIHQALVLGIRDYFRKMDFKEAVLGLSGGIDSAVVCALACEALGASQVNAILLPSLYSSEHSLDDARRLVDNVGCRSQVIPIATVTDAFDEVLKEQFRDLPFGVAEENIQARSRAVILMALSNKFGWVLLNTSNKSEAAVGYGTLYGDMCGGISVIGDLYKTQVYELAYHLNRDRAIIPHHTLVKAPSAELRPHQKDSDSLPDYAILDAILFDYIEHKMSINSIVAKGYDLDVVKRVVKMVNAAEYKRYQTPPTLRISPKAFGAGRNMPIVARFVE